MPLATIADTSIYYEEAGKGEALLMLHGLGSCGADWMLQIPHFSSGFRVISVDLPGHGKSGFNPAFTIIKDLAKACKALLDSLQISSCHIMGLSLGSFVALELALDYPEKVKSLILTGTSASVPDLGPLRLKGKKLLLALFPMSIIAYLVAWSCLPGRGKKALREQVYKRIRSNDKATFRKLFELLSTFDVKKRLPDLRCPVLIIMGEQDLITSPQKAKKMFKNMPKNMLQPSRFELIPNAGHLVPIEDPAAFNALVSQFLQQVRS